MPIALGLMSGTSCDGISAAAAEFNGRHFNLLAEHTFSYTRTLRQRLQQAHTLRVSEISAIHVELGECFAKAARRLLHEAALPIHRVTVIGSHGHTLHHGPREKIPSSWQIGEPSVIALRTGIPVISNFRSLDVAAGGEGAPLVPYFDATFFGSGKPRALVNIGGIANVSIVGRRLRTIAFDTGPGNTLLDSIVARITRGRHRYDRNGSLALRGTVDWKVLSKMRRDSYFRRRPPKSTGKEYFNTAWLNVAAPAALRRRPFDLLATVTTLTAITLAEGLKRYGPKQLSEVILSGGGAHNRTLVNQFKEQMLPIPVHSSEVYGLPVLAKEPVAFAYLALRALQRRPNHLAWTTGARSTCVLGNLTLAPIDSSHSRSRSRKRFRLSHALD